MRTPGKRREDRSLPNSCHTHMATRLSHSIPRQSGPLTVSWTLRYTPCPNFSYQRFTLAKVNFSFFPQCAFSIWNLYPHTFVTNSPLNLLYTTFSCAHSGTLTSYTFRHLSSTTAATPTPQVPSPFSFAPLYTPSHLSWASHPHTALLMGAEYH